MVETFDKNHLLFFISLQFLLINGFLPSHMDVLILCRGPVSMSAPTPRLNPSDCQTLAVPYLGATHHIEKIKSARGDTEMAREIPDTRYVIRETVGRRHGIALFRVMLIKLFRETTGHQLRPIVQLSDIFRYILQQPSLIAHS